MLRRGNKASAKYWRRVLLPVIERYRHLDIPKFFRGDAAFANPALYRLLEKEGYGYAIRIKSNAVLEREIEHLSDPTRGSSVAQAEGLLSQLPVSSQVVAAGAARGRQDRMARGRVVPRVGFIVTNLSKHSKNVVKFYNGRGTAEQWIKEGKNAVKWTKLSCRTFKDNQTRLQLFALAYNLANFLRRLGTASRCRALVADDTAREAGQDRSQGDAARQVRHVPTGRGGRATAVVCRDP